MLYTVNELIKWEKGMKEYVWEGIIIFKFESLYNKKQKCYFNK